MLARRLWHITARLLPIPALHSAAELFPPLNQQPFRFVTNSSLTSTSMPRAPVIALSHGGGPMPLMDDPSHKEIVRSLRTRVPEILKLGTDRAPRAIVLVTAHWSAQVPTISSADRHKLFYDYYGFPPETYQLEYEAPGSNEVAKEVYNALTEVGLNPELNTERGWDHGVFVPMLLINPAANIPIIQLSVLSSESPAAHYQMGRALSKLRDSNVAVIGSGFASFHNLRLMFSGIMNDKDFLKRNKAWNSAVSDAVTERDEAQREKKLMEWRTWPGAYEMHPRGGAEHFLPLVVCAGAGGAEKAKSYHDNFNGLDIYSFYWS